MLNNRLLLPSLLLVATITLPAQVWNEVGDAGQGVGTAQLPIGVGALLTINGSLAANDADLYVIQINTPASFAASTVGLTTVDTQLFLFELDGRGVAFNDDSIGLQSTLTSTFVTRPGKYVLAVSQYDYDPIAIAQQIWNDNPFGSERAPDGPSRLESLSGWAGTAGTGGTYAIALAGAWFVAKEAVMPDYEYLCESQTQLGNGGSTAWWRGTGGRFQILYEASHLLSAGVTGPIAINALKFRGEDGEPNVGGQSWSGVSVAVGSTSLDNTTMSTTFATNTDPSTTTMGTTGIATVTVGPSLGSTPNNYNIVIDLAGLGAAISHDPTSARPHLLIDVTMPTAATIPTTSGAVMAMQDATGAVAVVRGEGVNTATPASATGATSSTPLVVGIDFTGPGGYYRPIPARNEFIGAACGASPSSFYQSFLQGQDFDLIGLTLTPDNVAAPSFYTVTGGAGAFDPTKVLAAPLSTSDDALVTAALGFTHYYPGGTTTDIKPCTNGFVWLDVAMTSSDLSPTVGEFLGTAGFTARHAIFWMDGHAGRNTATHPNSGLHVFTDTSGGPGNAVCYVTWLNTGIFNSISTAGSGGQAVLNLQCAIHEATGVVEYRYGSALRAGSNGLTSAILVGFSRGTVNAVASVDPRSRDLSVEVPFVTSPEVAGAGNMGLTAVATPEAGGVHYAGRMFAGQTLTWNVVDVPAGAPFGAQLVDFAVSRPGFSLGSMLPGCVISTGTSPFVLEFFIGPSTSVSGAATFLVPPGFLGAKITSQFVAINGAGFVVSSNALRQTVGLR